MTGRVHSCLLAATLIAPVLLPAQRSSGASISFHNPVTSAPPPSAAVSAPTTLQELAQHAGVIVSGVVTSIDRPPAAPGQIPAVAVTFRVERGVRGTPGLSLTFREWRGLWNDAPRYRAGERLLLFLYPPSRLGLTSTVGGALGRFHVDSAGNVVITARQARLFGARTEFSVSLAEFLAPLSTASVQGAP